MANEYLFAIAVILIFTKIFGLASRKVKMPAVLGSLIAGILLGPVSHLVTESDFLTKSAEIGVILLMFMAGLETNLEEIKHNLLSSIIVATIGIIVPLIGGFITYAFFFGIDKADPLAMLKALFIGVTLTATSVSITVETLREMGRLRGSVGTTILGAAVIDDILGIIVLTFIISLTDSTVKISSVFIKIIIYFLFVAAVAVLMNFIIKVRFRIIKRKRFAVFSMAFCLTMSFIAEEFFGIADITGAFFSGMILCNFGIRDYINEKIDGVSFLFFSPIFFASIGLQTSFDGFTGKVVSFGIALLFVAILSKIIGCGLGAKLCRFNNKDSLAIGCGMVSRGEVALIVAQKGLAAGIMDPHIMPALILMVIVTTVATPVLLRFVFDN